MIEKYKISKDICFPPSFDKEPLNEIVSFNLEAFMGEFERDFERVEPKERFFFTDSMTDEYIQWSLDYCLKELKALENNEAFFNEYEWSWGR